MTDSPPDSFLRPVKVILLLLIGGLVYLVALMATLPAGWLWQQVEPRVELPPGVSVDRVTGSLWQGMATLAVVDRKVEAGWQVHSPSFANRALPLSFS
ncbi:MAG: hypothetical protein KGY54_14020, partial [Oleiphilaceae bacterium]|nr:hypothetical protein [Oleiphilaceae bacterium]